MMSTFSRLSKRFHKILQVAVCLAGGVVWGTLGARGPAQATPIAVMPTRPAVGSRSSKANERVLVDLSKKETFVVLPVNADPEDVRITDIRVKELPVSYRLVPSEGIARLGQPVDVQMEQPSQIRIRVAVVRRGRALALRVSPQIVLSQSEVLDLSRDRVARAARALQRQIKDLNQRLVVLAREREAIHTWLCSPGNKPLSDVKVARARLRLLSREIQTQQKTIPVARRHCQALGQVATFVQQLHNSAEIHYRVTIAKKDEER